MLPLSPGGATGIGFALAKKFLAHGNQVILVGRNEMALQDACRKLPGASYCAADVTRPEDRARLVSQFPGVTVLVNNAGIQVYKPIEDSTQEEIEREIKPNPETRALYDDLYATWCELYPATKEQVHRLSR